MSTNDATVGWSIDHSEPYGVNALLNGQVSGYSGSLDTADLIIENIMMNDYRNDTEHRCMILQNTTIRGGRILLYVAGKHICIENLCVCVCVCVCVRACVHARVCGCVCNMAMRDLPDMYARIPQAREHTYQANHKWPCYNYYVSLCSHSNNTSGLNPTSKCHTCSQGYKYKLLMHYSQGVECLHLPTMFIFTLCIRNQVSNCDNALWFGIATPLDQRFIH